MALITMAANKIKPADIHMAHSPLIRILRSLFAGVGIRVSFRAVVVVLRSVWRGANVRLFIGPRFGDGAFNPSTACVA